MNKTFLCGAALVVGATLASGNGRAQAQTALPPQTPAPELQTATIVLRNIKPSLMAYWLDPSHQPRPFLLRISENSGGNWTRDVDELERQPGNGNGPRGLKLPNGIQSIVSVDPQNVLVAKGTAQALEALKELVKEIDVPLKQVDIEAQIVEIAPADLASFPLKFYIAPAPPDAVERHPVYAETALALSSSPGELVRALNDLIADQGALVVTAPRLTVVNGLVGAIISTEIWPFSIDEKLPTTAAKDDKEDLANVNGLSVSAGKPMGGDWKAGTVRLRSEIGFSVLPVLRGELIALAFQVSLNGSVAQASATLRDGQMLAMRLPGVDDEERTRLVLITPRIVVRPGDDVALGNRRDRALVGG